MKLFIAEKPSLGRAIAEELGIVAKDKTHIQCENDTIVTWCFGHLLELFSPAEYDQKWEKWTQDSLPILPAQFKLHERSDTKTQLNAIGRLLQQAQSVVNAGDPDREGQLLVDEVLERWKWTGPTERIWLASLDKKSIQTALKTVRKNTEYAPLRDAARARSQADWLIGMNATRAMSIQARMAGVQGVQSIGRVQTPTLALVVGRDREREQFKPHTYYQLLSSFVGGDFWAVFKPDEAQPGLDSEGRLIDEDIANTILQEITGRNGAVTDVRREKKLKPPPLPPCLSSLQKQASARFGMTAQQVLDIAQSLYEARLTTYPRSDCQYLPEEQFPEAASILHKLSQIESLAKLAGNADARLRSQAWNTKKITAHHAIIPTGELPEEELDEKSRALYMMICQAYCVQFYPPCEYESQKMMIDVQGTLWEAKGHIVLKPGWTGTAFVENEDEKQGEDDENNGNLPLWNVGDSVLCKNIKIENKQTTPPPAFTEGTLIEAMANIHRFINDKDAKKCLKENEGIGTEATRADILEKLKARGFLETKKKKILSTKEGQALIEVCPDIVKNPVTTAQWETRLTAIASGQDTLSKFMADQYAFLPQLVSTIFASKIDNSHVPKCPVCGMPLVHRQGKKDGRSFDFWGCSGFKDGCTATFANERGKPGERIDNKPKAALSEHKCPVCGLPLIHRQGSKNGRSFDFWGCSGFKDGCSATFANDQGKPGERIDNKPKPALSEYKCPKCKGGLIRRKGKSAKTGKPYDFFACQGKCKATYNTKGDEPDFDVKKQK